MAGKKPDERKRPPPRHSLLEQGLHPHPGPLQEDTAAGSEDASLDPNTFLFLGADPADYGLSMRNGQGPPEDFIARPGSIVNDSDPSEDELIEDDDDDRPPSVHSIRIDDDDELGEAPCNRDTGFSDWYGDPSRHDRLCMGQT